MTVLGLVLILLGAGVLVAMRHQRWPWRTHDAAPEPADERPVIDFEAQPIYVPEERGTIYVSGIPHLEED
ncbi:hypothetical protein Pa4123_90990 [Phytohabitans aurantiacus]|uniref:Uncharacterized protein n=1 Tax=Phytohabitans aurantiacus TaxID=3016789 RepID=A0ABQ5RAQ2_9ACTN|nr:hypothetical protein Pa4123_90990 [Phytohabitans aurantiacus]